jgi:hypothetical protein
MVTTQSHDRREFIMTVKRALLIVLGSIGLLFVASGLIGMVR